MTSEDFNSLDFIAFQADESRHKIPLVISEIEGNPCLLCKDKCRGLSVHPWRKYCIFCKCAVECHDIPQNSSYQNLPEDRMCVEEKPPRSSLQKVKEAHIEGYEWIPAGLSGTQIEYFMSRLPKDKIPRLDSQGAMYRLKELVYQMPLQDFSSKHCRKLPLEQKMVMDDMCITRINKALGVGAVKPGLTVPSTCERCGIPMNVGDMAVFAFHAGPDLCWHVECFVCSNDGGLLVDHVYCWDSDERKLFCPRHWNECLKPRCAGCEELIYVGEYSRAMDAHWHPGHLCCFNCDESLSQQKFIIVENEPSCIKCYERNFANSCQNCGSSIGPGMKDVDVRGKHWHEDCFVCSECKKALFNPLGFGSLLWSMKVHNSCSSGSFPPGSKCIQL